MNRRGFLWMALAALGVRVAKPVWSTATYPHWFPVNDECSGISEDTLRALNDRIFDHVWDSYRALTVDQDPRVNGLFAR